MTSSNQNRSNEVRAQESKPDRGLNIPLFTLFFSLGILLLLIDKQWFFLSHPDKTLPSYQKRTEEPDLRTASLANARLGPQEVDASKAQESELTELAPGVFDAGSPTYDIKICNKSTLEKLYVAIGYYNQISKSWVAKGWFVADHDDCFIPLKNIKPPVYAYAESVNGNARWGVGNIKGNFASFCIDSDNKFTFARTRCEVESADPIDALQLATSDDKPRQGEWRSFTKLNFSGKGGTFTWNLAEP